MKERFMRRFCMAITGVGLLFSFSITAIAQEKWFIGPRIGVGVFTGIVGFEAQREHWALAAGWPYTLSTKYYFNIP